MGATLTIIPTVKIGVKGQTAETASDEELNRKLTDLESALKQALDAVQPLVLRCYLYSSGRLLGRK